jgi:hypothetical protein
MRRLSIVPATTGVDFSGISAEMARITALRDEVIMDAFVQLERQHALLAKMIIEYAGTRRKAAIWMCSRQDIFDRRMGYDLIASGELDTLWDEVIS